MKYLFYILSFFSFFFISCGNDEVEENEELGGEKSFVQLNLSIPSDRGVSTRAWGDPGDGGITEKVPRYIYIFTVLELSDGKFKVDIYPDNGACDPHLWTLDKTENVVKWKYPSITLSLNVVKPGKQSKIYVITSYDELPEVASAHINTKEDVEKLMIELTDPPKVDIYNVYANAANDAQNGAIFRVGDSMYADVLCSHIVARIDIQWNIAPTFQKQYAMRQITVSGLPSKAYFFKPLTPLPGEAKEGSVVTRQFHVGNQWYGRWVCYAFDRNLVNCTYVLDSPSSELYGAMTPIDGPANGTKKVFQKEYRANQSTSGAEQEAYANWYRINPRFGY